LMTAFYCNYSYKFEAIALNPPFQLLHPTPTLGIFGNVVPILHPKNTFSQITTYKRLSNA
jgi:hypothetical protein